MSFTLLIERPFLISTSEDIYENYILCIKKPLLMNWRLLSLKSNSVDWILQIRTSYGWIQRPIDMKQRNKTKFKVNERFG